MPQSNRLLRKRPAIDQNDVWTPGNIVQMDAVVAACAMVSQADGWVTPDPLLDDQVWTSDRTAAEEASPLPVSPLAPRRGRLLHRRKAHVSMARRG